MLIYGSSRVDVNRVSRVICVISTTLPFEPIKCQSKYFRFPALRASCTLCFSLWLILRAPLLSSDCSLQLPWIWCYETRAKVL